MEAISVIYQLYHAKSSRMIYKINTMNSDTTRKKILITAKSILETSYHYYITLSKSGIQINQSYTYPQENYISRKIANFFNKEIRISNINLYR